MKKRKQLISLLLAIALLIGILPTMGLAAGTPFQDVPGNAWYYDAVSYVSENGIMAGTADNQFSPEMEVTRAQMCQILYNMEDKPESSGSAFSDVTSADWFSSAVSWAASVGIVSGVGDGKFAPHTPITREQAMTILYNYASYKGYGVTVIAELAGFADASQISPWANTAMQWAVGSGYLSGVSQTELQPYGTTTRAQMAMVLMRFSERQSPDNMPAHTSAGGGTTPSNPSYDEDAFKAKDMDDFEGYEILNFDDSTETNFAVLRKETVVASTTGTTNQLVRQDNENGVYVIENINEDIANLKAGDILYFSYGSTTDDYLLLKVGSITKENGTATITAASDTEISDYYEYVDIDMEIEIPNDEEPQPQLFVYDAKSNETADGDTGDGTHHFDPWKIINIEEDGAKFLVTDTVTVIIQTFYDTKLVLGLFEVDTINKHSVIVRQKFDITASLEKGKTYKLSDEAKELFTKDKTIWLGHGFSVTASIAPVLEFTANATISSTFSVTCENGFTHDYDLDKTEIIQNEPITDSSISIKGNFSGDIGAEITVAVGWTILSTGITATGTLGIEGELEKNVSTATAPVKHNCAACVDGNFNFKFGLGFDVEVCKQPLVKMDFFNKTIRLRTFYISFFNETSKADFGWGECPHKAYLVTITVKDKDGTVPGASLLISGNGIEPIKAETNKNGVYKTYFTNGTYTAFAQSADEENFRTRLFTVKDNAIKFSIIISRDGTGPEEPEESEVPNEPGQNTAEPKRRLKTIDVSNYSVAVINEENICVREGTNTNFEDTWYWNDEDATDVISVSVAPPYSGAETFLKSDRSLWFQYWPTSSYKIADDVLYLCGRFFIKSDHSLWEYNFKYNYGSNDHGIGVYSVTLTKLMDDVAFIGGDKTKEPINMQGNGNPKGLLPDFVFKTDGAIEFFSGRWPEEPPSGDWTDIVDIHGTYQNAFYVKSDGTAWAQPYEYIADGEEAVYEMVMDNVVSIEMINCDYDLIKDENNKYFHRYKNTYAVIRADGSLWMWGANDCGQIGNGTTEYQETPIKIMDDVADISISSTHAYSAVFAIKTDGTLWRWGRLQTVGDLTLVPERAPGIIVPLPKDIDDGISGTGPSNDKTSVGDSINIQFADVQYGAKASIFFVDPNSTVNIDELLKLTQKGTSIPEAQQVLLVEKEDKIFSPLVWSGRIEGIWNTSELFRTGPDSYDFDGLVAVFGFEDDINDTTPYFYIASTTGFFAPTQ